jgi:hypothetical protein
MTRATRESAREHIAYLCSHVFSRERPVLYVSRVDGDWQFLCGADDHPGEKPRVVHLSHLFEHDLGLEPLRDLQPEFEAERESANAPWRQFPAEPANEV